MRAGLLICKVWIARRYVDRTDRQQLLDVRRRWLVEAVRQTLAADGAISANLIGSRPVGLHLFALWKVEELLGDIVGLAEEFFGDAVAGHDQEPDVTARLTNLLGHGRLTFGSSFSVGRQINHWYL